ncbi:MAG: molybdopterin-dependent oxidoreductase [Acidimicrobiia bacterium]
MTVPSFCRICTNACPILVDVSGGRVTAVTGDPDDPVYRGYSCVKGRAQPEFLAHPDRLLRSMKRRDDGSYAPIPFADAVGEIAERLNEILQAHGPRSIAAYWGTMVSSNVVMVPMLDAFLKAIGSPMEFSAITIDKPGKNIARALHGNWMAPRQGFDAPDVALLIGINPLVSYQGVPLGNPGRWVNDALRRGMALIVIDPRRSDIAKRATIHLQCRPGHDAEIVAAMIKVIIDEGRYDHGFVEQWVSGIDELRAAVAPFTPDLVAERAGVGADDLVRAARVFADARRGYATPGTGPSMSGPGTLIEYLVLCLETLCGHWLREGERVRYPGVLMPAFSAKAQAAAPMAGYGVGEAMRVRGLSRSIAGMPTAALADEILLEGDGQVRALISGAGNPATARPDQRKTIAALRSLDLFVQIDPWMSQSARLAHYVIAPRMPLEMAASSVGKDFQALASPAYGPESAHGQYTPAVVDPPLGSEVVEDWELFYALAQRMGLDLEVSSFLGKPITPFHVDMTDTPSTDDLLEMLSRGSRIALEEVKRHPRGADFSEPAVFVAPADPDCVARLDVGNVDMMADLASVFAGSMGQGARDADAPIGEFHLLCRRSSHVFNSSCNDATTNRGRAYNPAFVHPDDLVAVGVSPGDVVMIANDNGSVRAVAAADPTLRRGIISMSVGFGEPTDDPGGLIDEDVFARGTSVNRLLSVDAEFDRYSGQPLMSNVPVTLSRA